MSALARKQHVQAPKARVSVIWIVAVPLLAIALLAAPAHAATIDVSGEPGTALGIAILAAEPGDTIEIPEGVWTLTEGDVLEEKDLTLRGAGEGKTIVVPSGGGEAFDDEGVTVEALTVGDAQNPSGDDASGDEEDEGISFRAQVIAIVVTLAIFLFVLDLVRRRRLAERYALLWMIAALFLLILAIWTGGLEAIAEVMGIAEPANAIFLLAFGLGFLLLLNFSVASSRLSEETKVLAQEVARLDQELREMRSQKRFSESGRSARAEHAADEAPVPAEGNRE